MNPPSSPTRVQDEMEGAMSSIDRVLTDFLKSILQKISGEPTREGFIEIHQLISGNVESVASNLGRGQHGHLTLTMTAEEYME